MGAGQSSSKVETIDTTRLEKDEEEMLVKGESLVDDLTKLSLELVDEYYLEFLRPDFCNRVALISTKLLMDSTNSQEINGAEHVLGLVSGESEMKEKLCEQIVRHYIDRVNPGPFLLSLYSPVFLYLLLYLHFLLFVLRTLL